MASQTQTCCGDGEITMCSTYLTRTKVGKLKIASAIFSFLAMCFVSAGIDWINRRVGHSSLASASAALIIIAWLFSVFIIVAAFVPDLTRNPNFPKIDTYGHLLCAVTAFVGAGLGIGLVVDTYENYCTDTYKLVNGDNCTSFVLWTTSRVGNTAGLKLVHFIIAAAFAIVQAVVSIFIWREVVKTQKTEPQTSL